MTPKRNHHENGLCQSSLHRRKAPVKVKRSIPSFTRSQRRLDHGKESDCIDRGLEFCRVCRSIGSCASPAADQRRETFPSKGFLGSTADQWGIADTGILSSFTLGQALLGPMALELMAIIRDQSELRCDFITARASARRPPYSISLHLARPPRKRPASRTVPMSSRSAEHVTSLATGRRMRWGRYSTK